MLARNSSHVVRDSCTILVGLVLIGLTGPTIPAASGQLYSLVDLNAQLDIDVSQQATAYNWIVDSKDHLTEFSNWYRIGNAPTDFEQSLHSLMVGTPLHEDLDFSGEKESLTVEYESPGNFRLAVQYGVFGGGYGSGYSTMGECFTLTNLRTTNLNFHLFEYMDLDLDETSSDDVAFVNGSILEQLDLNTTFNVSRGTSNHFEIEEYPFTLSHLSPSAPYLNITRSILNDSPAAGPDNVTLALQWDFNLPGNATVNYCKNCELRMLFHDIPEPTNWIMATFGGAALISLRRRRSLRS